MICNIIDRRNREYRWNTINAIIENTAHDNSCKDSDQLTELNNATDYEQRASISLHDAFLWAEAEEGKVTLYLYDDGDGFDEDGNDSD